ncbi:hypothetical protein [Streptomyces sp. NBC_01304]|uniref:hypothetical protein n=1 Tax=Streptomyces sp. NBC_01304 TaxID=2903818 RepID=UPI002E137F88|nr:hypothetical protein OG430_07060 [Streptomyces sp. NBC_01304]
MTKLLLSVHVLVAILAVGSITVAASMFPRYALQAVGIEGEGEGEAEGQGEAGGQGPDGRAAGIAALLHRVCRGYALAGLAVPVFGIATGAQLGVLTDAWLIASLALTTIAAALLALAILPGQQRLLALAESSSGSLSEDAPPRETARPTASRLTMLTGIFNVLWAAVVVLMIVRPGSTTGA